MKDAEIDSFFGTGGHQDGTEQRLRNLQLSATGTGPKDGVPQSAIGELATVMREAFGDNRVEQTLVHIRKLE
ncbi:hypothetical protein AAVH_31083, partial [Aphelenchoides avenae]